MLPGKDLEVRFLQVKVFQNGIRPLGVDDFPEVFAVLAGAWSGELFCKPYVGLDHRLVQKELQEVHVHFEECGGTGVQDGEEFILVVVEKC